MSVRALRGALNHQSGAAAEQRVALDYERRGFTIARRRWRGPGGEIDLILRRGAEVVFVEVKKARDFATAAARVTPRQMGRVSRSAEVFLSGEPAGSLTPARIDVALVDGIGAVQILENAWGQC